METQRANSPRANSPRANSPRANSSKSASRFLTTTKVIQLLFIGYIIRSLHSIYTFATLEHETNDEYELAFVQGPPLLTYPKNSSKTKTTLKSRPTEELLTKANSTSTSRNETIIFDNIQRNEGCLSHLNSRAWIEDKRLGNINSDDSRFIDDDYVASSILSTESLLSGFESNSQNIIKQAICAKSSRFQNLKFSSVAGNGTNDFELKSDDEILQTVGMRKHEIIQQLSVRLFYLSVHIHQNRHAITEAKHRLANPEQCDVELVANDIGKFDFECPDAKFLLVPMKKSGLGSQIRLITAPAFRVGIASDRVVLFVNRSPAGEIFLKRPWSLSSCPRGDKQCFFLPDSPCVVTNTEVQNATALSKGERRALFKTGELPDHLENERVILMDPVERPQRTPTNFKRKTVDIVRKFLIDPLAQQNPADPILPLLATATEYMLEEDEPIGDTFFYFGRNSLDSYAFMFYSMRPRVEFADRIDHIVDSSLGENHQTNLTLGLPIRASDKCEEEAECPSFETYMSLMQNIWETNKKSFGDETTSIILTSESPDIFKAQRVFQEKSNTNHTGISFPSKFVTNTYDILQDTGYPEAMPGNESKEDILVSSLSSFKMQLNAKYNVANCCSLFHTLLIDFLRGGCGASYSGHVAECMQDHENERFQICCSWTKTDVCQAKRDRKAALAMATKANTTNN